MEILAEQQQVASDMMSSSITDDRNAQLTTQLESLEKRLMTMEKRNQIVLQTKKTRCLLATIHRLVLERSPSPEY
ncbi:hypothetical protein J4Q44_G00281960 [Coregonus suidteri]|uniref:Uncharacterized protein n=1 Tax=Coregonus suidteri TaxID=861788 RepID=A0AAN8L1X9_9TELE